MSDTPRTAATARDALLREVNRHERLVIAAMLDDYDALAAAEAPGRVAALEAERRTLLYLIREWSQAEDPYTEEGDALVDYMTAALAAPAPTPSEPVGRPHGVHNHRLDPSCRETMVGGAPVGECLIPLTPAVEP